jgi:hypothetical protein
MNPSPLQLRAHLPPPPAVEPEAASGSSEDYDDRNGYLPDFLGESSDFLVPLSLPMDKGDLVQVEERGRRGHLSFNTKTSGSL